MVKHGEGRRVWCELRVPNVSFADCVGGGEIKVSFYCYTNSTVYRAVKKFATYLEIACPRPIASSQLAA